MHPKWQFDELNFSGVDFCRPEEVLAYDSMHKKFRDYAQASEGIMRRLSLDSTSAVIDLGAGSGAFALYAAWKCRVIYAVDISAAMLDYTRKQAEKEGIANIVFCHGGLLTYEHGAELADAAVCVAVLHHLPDFWKQIALTRCCAMLKPGGRFFLFDIVFPSGAGDIQHQIDGWLASVEAIADPRLAQEAVLHIKKEFSTYDWIMEGIIQKSGFYIDETTYDKGFQATYICTKK